MDSESGGIGFEPMHALEHGYRLLLGWLEHLFGFGGAPARRPYQQKQQPMEGRAGRPGRLLAIMNGTLSMGCVRAGPSAPILVSNPGLFMNLRVEGKVGG